MQKKGIIMQIAHGHAIVMTKDREFLKIPLLDGMSVGLEVAVPANADIRNVSEKKRNWFSKTWKQTGVAAACLMLAVGLWSSQSLLGNDPKAYAYVTMDINPSIELSIDENHKVVDAKALNQDGEQVLIDLKLNGMPVEEAISKVAEMAKNKGFMNDQTEVLITASPGESAQGTENDLDQMEGELVATVQKVATVSGAQVDVEGIVVSSDVRDAAKEVGVSPGKYAFYLSAQSKGVDVKLDELKKESIHAIIDKQGTEYADVIHDIRGGKDLDELHDIYKKEGKDALKKVGGTTKATVQPKENNKRQEEDKKETTPPGQSKKEEIKQQSNTPSNGKKQESSDREESSKSNGNGKAKDTQGSNKQDDKGSRDSQNSNKATPEPSSNSQDKNGNKQDTSKKKDTKSSEDNKNRTETKNGDAANKKSNDGKKSDDNKSNHNKDNNKDKNDRNDSK